MKREPKRSHRVRLFRSAFYVVLVLVMIFVSASALQKINGKTVFLFGRTTVWVLTDSMEDTIPAESYILIRSSDGTDVQIGDVITFYSSDPDLGGQLNTHRVTDVQTTETGKREFITRGDNSRITENDRYTVKESAVMGIYERNLPVMTFFARIFLTQIGLFLIVGVLVALIVFCYWDDLKRLVRAVRGIPEPEEAPQTPATLSEEEIQKLVAAEVERMKAEANREKDSTENAESLAPQAKSSPNGEGEPTPDHSDGSAR